MSNSGSKDKGVTIVKFLIILTIAVGFTLGVATGYVNLKDDVTIGLTIVVGFGVVLLIGHGTISGTTSGTINSPINGTISGTTSGTINASTSLGASKQLKEINLMLIGHTGHGKSSTGNSILMEESFGVSDSMNSFTNKPAKRSTDVDGVKVNVIDTPGLFDTEYENSDHVVERLIEGMNEECSENIDCFLLVFKYGIRMTSEEVQTFEKLRMIFSEELFKHCILVLTNKGDFVDFNGNEKAAVARWISQQGDDVKNMLACSQDRFMFFDNKKPQDERQRQTLLQMVQDKNEKNGRFSKTFFEEAHKTRAILKLTENLSDIQERYNRLTLLLVQLNKDLTSLICSSHKEIVTLLGKTYSYDKFQAHEKELKRIASEHNYRNKSLEDLVHIVIDTFQKNKTLAFTVRLDDLKSETDNASQTDLKALKQFAKQVVTYVTKGENEDLTNLLTLITDCSSKIDEFLTEVKTKNDVIRFNERLKKGIMFSTGALVAIGLTSLIVGVHMSLLPVGAVVLGVVSKGVDLIKPKLGTLFGVVRADMKKSSEVKKIVEELVDEMRSADMADASYKKSKQIESKNWFFKFYDFHF